jgi:hypothetical protein
MKFKVRKLAVLVLSAMCINAYGQLLRADLAFDGLFDNREFKNDMLPQTIYGMRVMPQIGIDYGKHSLVAGLSKVWEFGSDQTIDPDVIMYYQYGGEKWTTMFGAIPRKNLQRQLPDAFLYDSIAFFDATIGGTVIQYHGRLLQSELYCNWFSRQSYTKREAFRIVWDGYVGNGVIGGGWFTAMTHYANTMQHNLFLYEKFQLNPFVSVDLTSVFASDLRLKADAGLLCSLVRCRNDHNWFSPTGFLGDIEMGWRMFDVKNMVYVGGLQQPFMNDPQAGPAFHRNDPFYNHHLYNKTEMGIKFIADENVELGFRWNVHFTPGSPVHNQQLITLKYRIGVIKNLNNPQ